MATLGQSGHYLLHYQSNILTTAIGGAATSREMIKATSLSGLKTGSSTFQLVTFTHAVMPGVTMGTTTMFHPPTRHPLLLLRLLPLLPPPALPRRVLHLLVRQRALGRDTAWVSVTRYPLQSIIKANQYYTGASCSSYNDCSDNLVCNNGVCGSP